jgi:hypothetical protein
VLDWLETILGEAYTEDIGKKVSAEIGKGFVARADFNALNEEKKTLAGQLAERDTQLEALKKVDADSLQAEITRLFERRRGHADHAPAEGPRPLRYFLPPGVCGVPQPHGRRAVRRRELGPG